MKIKNIPLQQYVNWLKNNEFFSFVRYGEGEWFAIFREKGVVSRFKQPLSPELQKDMSRHLMKTPRLKMVFGIQPYALKIMPKQVENFLNKHNLSDISWVNADIFHQASKNGEAFPLIKTLREKKVVIIGPDFLRKLSEQTLPYIKFIETPKKNCYAKKGKIRKTILDTRKKFGNGIVYSFSAGPLAEILILNLHKKIPKNFLIDFGSFWDVFCGRKTRGYTVKYYTEEILKKNLGLL